MDATEAWSLDIERADALDGLPESALEIMRRNAQEAGREGYRVTLRSPSVQAIMTHARDRALRERVYHAYQTRASEQGPYAGQFDNGPRMARILALKHESAQLLGFANAAEESLATKMAGSPARVLRLPARARGEGPATGAARTGRPRAIRARVARAGRAAALGRGAGPPSGCARRATR